MWLEELDSTKMTLSRKQKRTKPNFVQIFDILSRWWGKLEDYLQRLKRVIDSAPRLLYSTHATAQIRSTVLHMHEHHYTLPLKI